MSDSQNNLDKLRHTLAHLLARATLEHYPEAKPTLGPPVDDGFYYDIDCGDTEFSEDELDKIEGTMKEFLDDWELFRSYDVTADEAREFFADNEYKLELIDDIAEAGDDITLYYSGPKADAPEKADLLESDDTIFRSGFVDLCRGGHVDTPNKDISADSFTLDTVAGAYWRGDEDNQMLTRIYGLAFATEDDLDEFVVNRKKAKKRDHRTLGQELDLFTFSDNVGPGLPMLLPNGEIIRNELETYLNNIKEKHDYQFVNIPHIAKRKLYEKSGHMGKYDAMMPTFTDDSNTEYVMKAMNCPHHFEIYNSRQKSYRDLPLRIAENTTVYRNEKSGELHGLTRVINLMQDDAHHFIRPDQINDEIQMILDIMENVYGTLGFGDYEIQISVRDADSDQKYFGDDKIWKRAESILVDAVNERDIPYEKVPGEAAFYGPKIDVMVSDALGRQWQLTTVQLDFVQPDNFDMTYTGEDGEDHQVVVIHAAILGSFERFMGVLIEHTGGDFPLWLSPTQVALLPVGDDHEAVTDDIAKNLESAGIRTVIYGPDESVGKRIRNVHENKVPLFGVVGDDEVDADEITVESRRDDIDDITTEIDGVAERIQELIDNTDN
ncbi:MAG: threonine--tRNA ligase [Parcubacteria group bacterium SW_6_46_9]|nr:MAG: threonine--tRNA ligase [Parcubacteria group bacterium SW_6_46_9]